MTPSLLILAAAAGCICLAVGATLWMLAQSRRSDERVRALQGELVLARARAEAAQASAEAFDSALVAVEDGGAILASGAESLAGCAALFGLETSDPRGVINALMRADPDHAR